MNAIAGKIQTPMVNLLMSIADDKLFLGHCNSDWTGLAPILEADIAFSSLAQDDIAHASALYDLIGSITGGVPDQIAFGRRAEEYYCCDLVTKRDGFNWACAIAKQFYCNHFDYIRLQRLCDATWKPLASLSKRLLTEQAIHIDHVNSWVYHLGNGNDDSTARIQDALDEYAPLAAMMFEEPAGLELLRSEGVLTHEDDIYEVWIQPVQDAVQDAGLNLHIDQMPVGVGGGRTGRHDADFDLALAELQEVFSQDPAAAW